MTVICPICSGDNNGKEIDWADGECPHSIDDIVETLYIIIDGMEKLYDEKHKYASGLYKELEVAKKAIIEAERLLDNNHGFNNQETIDAWNILVHAKQELEKMTEKKDILDMEAGMDMDLLIHEKVMGKDPPLTGYYCPDYSTDITYTWDVIERIRELGGVTEIIAHCEGIYYCVTSKGVEDGAGTVEWSGSASADTAPLAVCKAALIACLDWEEND